MVEVTQPKEETTLPPTTETKPSVPSETNVEMTTETKFDATPVQTEEKKAEEVGETKQVSTQFTHFKNMVK